jgi:exodeoxyribonuclease V alpha subunit
MSAPAVTPQSAPTAVGADTGLSADRVHRLTGLLQPFNEAGVLTAADVHIATRLGRLGEESDERVLLAIALTVRAVRTGSVCLELSTAAGSVTGAADAVLDPAALPWPDPGEWAAACLASPLVAEGPTGDWKPLRLVSGLLYLDRYWQQEDLVRKEFDARVAAAAPGADPTALAPALHRLFPASGPDRQRLAAASVATRQITVLAGGPGTGKTTTVARMLALLHALPGPPPRIALAAPTGKAAARLQEAVRAETNKLTGPERDLLATLPATTVHRLLGWRPGSASRFRHDHTNRLPYDVVVIDETSMVSLTLMSRLLEALRPETRLVLVGDPDQLASVEAGAVLGDLVARPGSASPPVALLTLAGEDAPTAADDLAAFAGGVVRLETVHRFGEQIGALAGAIRRGSADEALDVLRSGLSDVEFIDADPAGDDPALLETLRADAMEAGRALADAALDGRVDDALEAQTMHRLLCAHRQGPYGVSRWSTEVQRWLGAPVPAGTGSGQWYAGQPLLVTRNDPELRLSNGDTGVIVTVPTGAGGAGRTAGGAGESDSDRRVVAAFGPAGAPLLISPARLPEVQTVYAMTVHRGQGSQFDTVSLILPPPESPLLTRELFYTAVTRAVRRIRVIGTADAVHAAVGRRIRRASGLQRVL